MRLTDLPNLPPGRGDHALAAGFYGLGGLMIAAAVHVVLVLAVPRRAERDAYARVAGLVGGTPLETAAGPDPTTPGPPYRDSAIAAAFCLYDVRDAPVRIEADVAGADFAGVSLHSRHGRTFYGLTNRSASGGRITLTIMTARQSAEAAARDTEDEPTAALRVVAPEPDGFAEIQVLAAEPSAVPQAVALASKLSCSAASVEGRGAGN